MSPVARRLIEEAPAIFAVSTFGLMLLFGVLGMGRLAGVTMVVGWFLLTPLSAVLEDVILPEESSESTASDTESTREPRSVENAVGGSGGSSSGSADEPDPVERLRQRYASGEIDEVEFERRLDALLATEDTDPETARDRLRQSQSSDRERADLDEELSDLLDDETETAGGREPERERE